jgi:hypothetical protein
MSRLSYANVGEAFLLGSDQIRNTQEEIAKLKALVMDSSTTVSKEKFTAVEPPSPSPSPSPQQINQPPSDDFDVLFLKLTKYPRFEEIIKNYINFKHPEWCLKQTNEKLLNSIFVFAIITLIIYLIINVEF